MTFLEQRLPVSVSRGSSGGPTALRRKVYDGTGRLAVQQFLRSYPLHRYTFDFGTRLDEDAAAVRDFFYVVLFTPYEGFRVRDWNDYTLTQSTSTLTFVSGTEWQIYRKYTAGAVSVTRPIYKPEDGSVSVYRTRGGVVSLATSSTDATTGLATIAGHVGGDTYTAEGRFDVPVTFASDDALARVAVDGQLTNLLQALGEIELEELRLS